MDPQAGGLLGRDGPADRRGARQRLAQGLARQLEGRGADEGCVFYSIASFFGLRSGLRFLEIQEGV